jgi:hypothetical protein
MNHVYIVVTLIVVIFGGCTSKSKYEPSTIYKKLSFNSESSSNLKDIVRQGATFEDGKVISTTFGTLDNISIPAGFRFVNETSLDVIISDMYGNLKILSKNSASASFTNKFNLPVVSATRHGNLLAMLDVGNTIQLFDLSSKSTLYKEKLSSSVAVDARVANPIFLNDIVVFPTLDGRLLVMDIGQKRVLRDIAISDKSIFNNVIFMAKKANKIVAATSSRVVLVTPNDIKHYKAAVKEILYIDDKIYIFTKEGRVILLNDRLEKLEELRFDFAIFSTVFENNKIYLVEKAGHIIEITRDLTSYKVYELPDIINKPVFGYKKQIFIGNKIVDIEK